jgi:hypothetical protein
MTQEEFIKILDKKTSYSYEIEGDKIIVTHKGTVDLRSLTSLPPDVVFKNGGSVHLSALTSLPPGVEFKNTGYVAHVDLDSLTSLPPGMEFKNGGDVGLGSLTGEWFDDWSGNIKYIDSKRLLNVMIKREMFI